MWDNDAMQDLANDLEQAGPTDRELDFIIAKGKLPRRLANTQFTNNDSVQFGEQGRDLTNTPRDRFISRMSPGTDMQKVAKVVNSPEFNSDTILKIVDAGDAITHSVGRYIQKEFDKLQYDLGRQYEDHPEEVAEKLLSMLKDRTQQGVAESRKLSAKK